MGQEVELPICICLLSPVLLDLSMESLVALGGIGYIEEY